MVVVLLVLVAGALAWTVRSYAPARNRIRKCGRGWLAKHVWKKFGPMSPRKVVRVCVKETVAAALPTAGGRVVPNGIRIGVSPSDAENSAPVWDELGESIAEGIQNELAADDGLSLLGGKPDVELYVDPTAKPHNPNFEFTHIAVGVQQRGTYPQATTRLRHRVASGAPTPPMRAVSTPMSEAPTRPMRGATTAPMSGATTPMRVAPTPITARRTTHRPAARAGMGSASGGRTQAACILTVSLPHEPEFEIRKKEGVFKFGRDRSCDVVIDEESVSGVHFELTVSPRGSYICDLNSTNGTWVDGVLAEKNVPLHPGTVVWLSSDVRLTIIVVPAPEKHAA